MTLLLLLLLKSLLVFAMSGIALLCLRRASASARHLVCLLTLFALLALPLFSMTLPGWQMAALQEEPTPQQAATLPQREGEEFRTKTGRVPPAVPPDSAAPTSTFAPSTPPRLPVPGGQALVPGRFLLLYFLGVLLASARPLLGLWGIVRLRRACVPVTDAPTLSVSADCAAALRLSRLPLLCRADVPVPMTWGGRRPVVLLPSGSEGWPEDRLRSVLLHEMAHVKRRDWACHRLADFACAVYWFHPLVWLTARRLRAESEIACDDLVLSSGIAAPEYARHLLEIASALPRPLPPHAAIAMAQTPHIKRRILMVLDKTRQRTLPRRAFVLGIALTAAALVPLAMLRPVASARSVSQTLKMPSDASVQIVGVKDINIYHTDHRWWQADGSPLTGAEPHAALSRRFQKDLFSSADAKNLLFAFHLPVIRFGETVKFISTGSLTELYQADASRSLWTLTSTFPIPQKATAIQVGVASHSWITAAAHAPVRSGDAGVASAYGNVDFSPIEHYPGNNWFVTVVADEPKRDQPRRDWRVVAVDAQGQKVYPVSTGSSDMASRFRLMAYFDKSVSSRHIRLFMVETRPFVWTEFKNVALQPVK